MTDFSPREIVSELDRFIVGQADAKRAVSIALRNRWRRLQLEGSLREEVLPKNILMIGPTGVGKTEISRRLARLAGAPFIKVEATKFTEVGYVGRDVEQIVRDLVEVAIGQTRERKRKDVKARAEVAAEERVLDALVGASSSAATRDSFRRKLRSGELDDKEIEVETQASGGGMPTFEIPGMPGAQIGAISIGDIFGKARRRPHQDAAHQRRRVTRDSGAPRNPTSCSTPTSWCRRPIHAVENNGIVFLDEIDKICARDGRVGGDVSREGVQRDLLPLIEGTTVSTKHGSVKTDHILFIASGAFHIAKPSDLLPELQGRLPIRVELQALTRDDFRRILTEPEASLIKQYVALMQTEGVKLEFTDDAIDAIADVAVSVNSTVENIGARRLQTVMERVLDEISFAAPDRNGDTIRIDAAYVDKHVGDLAKNADLSRFILKTAEITAPAATARKAHPRRRGRCPPPRSRRPGCASSGSASHSGTWRRSTPRSPSSTDARPLPVMTRTKVAPSAEAPCRKPISRRCARSWVMPCRSSRASMALRPLASCDRSRRPSGASGGGDGFAGFAAGGRTGAGLS